jgi:hypothetical protein
MHEVALEALKARARGSHHGQDAVRLFGAVHLGGGFNEPPHQIELAQRALAAHHVAHEGDEGVGVDAAAAGVARAVAVAVGHGVLSFFALGACGKNGF